MAAGRLLIIVLGVAAITFVILQARGCGGHPSNGLERVMIGGEKFDLEVAADNKSREQGLMDRTSIPEHGGMLFVFADREVQVQGFWMKNCPIDMDIIFLDPRGFVTATHHMKALPRLPNETELDYETRAREGTYSSVYPAQFAIELKAGTLDRLKVKVEDRIALDLDSLKARARKADEH